jgi:hypothetical protein
MAGDFGGWAARRARDAQDGRMTTKFSEGEQVWVPSSRLSGEEPFALVQRKVLGQDKRSVIVDDKHGETVKISSRMVHPKTLGFLVLKLGDMATEATLLDPLAKSVLQYLRLLISDDVITSLQVRTSAELEQFMTDRGAAFSHVILIGHGSSNALKLMGEDNWLPAKEFARLLGLGGEAKTLVSLACSTGLTNFARPVSAGDACKEFLAPFAEAHGASASMFVQYLLHAHLLHGHEFHTAARRADAATEGTTFRHWRNGKRF